MSLVRAVLLKEDEVLLLSYCERLICYPTIDQKHAEPTETIFWHPHLAKEQSIW